jgi:Holliday junction resolvasome RuvABC endonuclease subunit
MLKKNQTILALFPNRYGIGYAVFDTPDNLAEYGIGYIQPVSNKKTFKRVKEYITYYKPNVIITRNINDQKKSSKRIEKLIDCICNEAKSQGLEIHSYTRTQIKDVFRQFGASSKYQIARKIIVWYKQLESYMFPERKRWMTENHNTGIFDAVSLAMTHYYLE